MQPTTCKIVLVLLPNAAFYCRAQRHLPDRYAAAAGAPHPADGEVEGNREVGKFFVIIRPTLGGVMLMCHTVQQRQLKG
jgi:hypothetical protein